MTTRGGRPPHVRPRPPSTGRPAPSKVRPRAPAPVRLAGHRRVERTRRLALPFRALFAIAVVALGGAVLFAASGGLGTVASAIGATFGGFVADVTATPVPSSTPSLTADSPILQEPTEPYTNQPTIDLVGTVPGDAVGDEGSQIKIYVAIGEQQPAPLSLIPMPRTPRFIVPGVVLVEGTNAFTAAIVGPGGESEQSAVVTYVLDATKPRIVLTSPKNGAVVNAKTVKLDGETQPRSTMRARNASTNAIVTGAADENGKFSLILPIGEGTNDIGITSRDPAGNENHLVLAVRRGTGKLTAAIGTSIYQIKRSSLPSRVQLGVTVTDPDGSPLEGAKVTFSLAVPGVPAVTSKTLTTGGDGTASWSTTIPKGATTGQISATAIVRTSSYGDITDRTIITIVK